MRPIIARAALLCVPAALGLAAAQAQELTDGAGQASELPRPSIVLFWAIWCAPCREETDNLGALAAAAAPLPVIVAPLDSDRRTRRALAHVAPDRLRFVRAGGIGWMQRLTGAVGLPAAVAIDAAGNRCATKFGAVTPDDLATWRRKCAARRGD